MPDEQQLLQRKVQRERAARREAERLLDAKSREIYAANERLLLLTQKLEHQSELTAAIIQTAADGIVVLNDQGAIISVNPAFNRIFGFDESVETMAVDRLLKPANKKTMGVDFRESGEYMGERTNGEVFPLTWTVSEVPTRKEMLWTAFVRDQSHERQLQMQLTHAQKMESVGLLAAGVAHEINTPIQYIGDNVHFLSDSFEQLNGLLEACQRLTEEDAARLPTPASLAAITDALNEAESEFLATEIPEAISQTLDGIRQVTRIVQSMKQFSHPGGNEVFATDVNEIVRNSITVSRNAWKYCAQIELDLESDLPTVLCYPAELNQALLNLIVNATHAVAEVQQQKGGGSRGMIRVATRSTEDEIRIELSDTGSGIPQEIIDRIFVPFFTTKPIGIGTGQGLAVVQAIIVKQHGGRIEVDSKPGVGTTFHISLPRSGATEQTSFDALMQLAPRPEEENAQHAEPTYPFR